MNIRFSMKRLIEFSTISMFIGLAGGAQGANELELSNIPLFLGDSVVPNVFIEMDDSGSMDWDVLSAKYWPYCAYDSNALGSPGSDDCGSLVTNGLLNLYAQPPLADTGSFQDFYHIFDSPDDVSSNSCVGSLSTLELCGAETNAADWRTRAAAVNVVYYNPTVPYTRWPGLEAAKFNAARSNPQPGTDGYDGYDSLRDLGAGDGFTYHVWRDQDGVGDKGFSGDRPQRGDNLNYEGAPNGQVDLWDTHIEFNVTGDSVRYRTIRYAPDATGMNPTVSDWTTLGTEEQDPVGGRTPIEIRQNIANWYQYGRRRSFVAKGAVGAVINEKPDFRYGLGVINDGLTVNMPQADVLDFSDHNDLLVERLYSYAWPSKDTPLRSGLKRVGEYFKQTGSAAPIIHACQQNYTVLFTDGYWNGGSPGLTPADADGDGYENTLADVARTYYTADLRPDLPDWVPVNTRDQAPWQHMVTFTIAFGIKGNLKDTTDNGDPDQDASGNTFTPAPDANWGNPSSGNPEKVDDLWHAAFNSSGLFVAADTPKQLIGALSDALATITNKQGSAAAVALNSGSLGNDTHLYQARFNSSSWSGQLLAFPINPEDGSVATAPVWDAGEMIEGQSEQKRVILSYDPATKTGIKFRYETIEAIEGDDPQIKSQSQMAALMTGAPNALPIPPDPSDYNKFLTPYNANKPYVKALVNFLRGDQSNEGEAGFRFRERTRIIKEPDVVVHYKLGDVVHSSPIYVGPPSFRYLDQWRDNLYPLADAQHLPENAVGNEYSGFRESMRERMPVIYFGANDGMLHGINATDHDDEDDTTTSFSEGGAELLAYVPSMLYERLPELASRDYIHKYYVDGGPTVVDAFVDGAWRTVLVGGLAGGGQGIYALDVTNPNGFSEGNASSIVMWEFSDADDGVDDNNGNLEPDLGYTYSRPAVVRLHNGKWAAVFGNGYNNTEAEADDHPSTSGNAVLYIVDLANGSLLKKIDTGVGAEQDPTNIGGDSTVGHRPNGLATAAPVDLDGDGIVDYIYAGDLFGNLWKFNVTSNSAGVWDVARFDNLKKPLFQATSKEGAYQPITSRPEVGRAPQGKPGVMVYFGTGKYLELMTDNTSDGQETQTFYGIWDNWEAVEPLIRGADADDDDTTHESLQKQEIELEQQQTFLDNGTNVGDFDVRTSTANDVDWSVQKGWYMDLIVKDPPGNQGERQVTPSVLRNNRIIFTTLLPSDDPCASGGDSWLMELDAFSGARLPYTPFDLNLDGVFDAEDYAELPADDEQKVIAVPASGVKSKVGITIGLGGAPRIITDGSVEHVYSSDSPDIPDRNPGKGDYGRQSWREL